MCIRGTQFHRMPLLNPFRVVLFDVVFFLPFTIFRLHYVLSRSLWLLFLTNLTRDNGEKNGKTSLTYGARSHRNSAPNKLESCQLCKYSFRVKLCSENVFSGHSRTGNAIALKGIVKKVKEERSTVSGRGAAAPMLANMNCNMMNSMVWNTYGNNGAQ